MVLTQSTASSAAAWRSVSPPGRQKVSAASQWSVSPFPIRGGARSADHVIELRAGAEGRIERLAGADPRVAREDEGRRRRVAEPEGVGEIERHEAGRCAGGQRAVALGAEAVRGDRRPLDVEPVERRQVAGVVREGRRGTGRSRVGIDEGPELQLVEGLRHGRPPAGMRDDRLAAMLARRLPERQGGAARARRRIVARIAATRGSHRGGVDDRRRQSRSARRPGVVVALAAWLALAPVLQALSLAGLRVGNFAPDRPWNYLAYGLAAPYVAWLVWRAPAARPLRRLRLPHARGRPRHALPPAGRGGHRRAVGAPAPASGRAAMDAVAPPRRDASALAPGADRPAAGGRREPLGRPCDEISPVADLADRPAPPRDRLHRRGRVGVPGAGRPDQEPERRLPGAPDRLRAEPHRARASSRRSSGGSWTARRSRSSGRGSMPCEDSSASCSFTTYYMAIAALPLATVAAVAFAAPLFVTAMSALVLGEPRRPAKLAAVLVGFAGVLVVLRPGAATFEPAALLAVLSALCYATSQTITRHLGRTDSGVVIVLSATLVSVAGVGGWAGSSRAAAGRATGLHPSLAFLVRGWTMPPWGALRADGAVRAHLERRHLLPDPGLSHRAREHGRALRVHHDRLGRPVGLRVLGRRPWALDRHRRRHHRRRRRVRAAPPGARSSASGAAKAARRPANPRGRRRRHSPGFPSCAWRRTRSKRSSRPVGRSVISKGTLVRPNPPRTSV